MSFRVVINYRKNSGENLVHEADDSLREESFNGLLDYLISVKPQLKQHEQQIVDVVARTYRNKHLEYLDQERQQGEPVQGQMELVMHTIDANGRPVDIREPNPTFRNRPVINLDRRISDHIKDVKVEVGEGKEMHRDVLEFMANYIPVVGLM